MVAITTARGMYSDFRESRFGSQSQHYMRRLKRCVSASLPGGWRLWQRNYHHTVQGHDTHDRLWMWSIALVGNAQAHFKESQAQLRRHAVRQCGDGRWIWEWIYHVTRNHWLWGMVWTQILETFSLVLMSRTEMKQPGWISELHQVWTSLLLSWWWLW